MTPLHISIAINAKWPGKKLSSGDHRWAEHTASFYPEQHSIESMIQRIAIDGCAFSAVMKDGYRKEANFVSAQHIGLDDDRGTQESSLDALEEDSFISSHAAFLYSTPSSTAEKPKSRVVFVLDEAFYDATAYRTAQEAMCWKFGYTDASVKEPARFFYGCPNTDHRVLGNVLHADVFQKEILDPYLDYMSQTGIGYKKQTVENKTSVGSRNATMASLVGYMLSKGFDKEAIIAAVHVQNELTFCPPLSVQEVDSVIASITKKPAGTPVVKEQPKLKITKMKNVQPKKANWLWPGRFPKGKLAVVAGDPGLGKSYLTLDIASRVSLGGPWPDAGTAPLGNVLFITAEDGLEDTVVPRLDSLGANQDRIYAIGISVDDNGKDVALTLDKHLQQIEDEIVTYSAVLLIIDPVLALTGKTDTHKAADVRAILTPLSAVAERTDCAVIAILHLNKNSKEGNALYRVNSSLDFVAAARSVMVVGEHPNDSESRVLASMKANLSAKPDSLAFHIDSQGLFTWEGAVDLDASSVLNLVKAEGKTISDQAKDFLTGILNDGPKTSTEVLGEALKNGFSESTLSRVAKALGIQKTRVGGFANNGHWEWSLSPKTLSTDGELLSDISHLSCAETPEEEDIGKQTDFLSIVESMGDQEGSQLASKIANIGIHPGSNLTKNTSKWDVDNSGTLSPDVVEDQAAESLEWELPYTEGDATGPV